MKSLADMSVAELHELRRLYCDWLDEETDEETADQLDQDLSEVFDELDRRNNPPKQGWTNSDDPPPGYGSWEEYDDAGEIGC